MHQSSHKVSRVRFASRICNIKTRLIHLRACLDKPGFSIIVHILHLSSTNLDFRSESHTMNFFSTFFPS
uniref:Uncharacterized protein n=1 Tax=Rhizophora mucronata TaxID=61149 RepID=A0A2P2PCH8_RHIMU